MEENRLGYLLLNKIRRIEERIRVQEIEITKNETDTSSRVCALLREYRMAFDNLSEYVKILEESD